MSKETMRGNMSETFKPTEAILNQIRMRCDEYVEAHNKLPYGIVVIYEKEGKWRGYCLDRKKCHEHVVRHCTVVLRKRKPSGCVYCIYHDNVADPETGKFVIVRPSNPPKRRRNQIIPISSAVTKSRVVEYGVDPETGQVTKKEYEGSLE